MEVLNDLLGYENRKIYQNTEWFSFNLDSILLANFVKINKKQNKILDIGTGTGIIPLILTINFDIKIDAIEIQKSVCDMCKKTIIYNKLENQINLINEDVELYSKNINNYYDIIISNPPYFKDNKLNLNSEKAISRHEIFLDLNKLIKVSKKMLKNGGSLYFIYPCDRLLEALMKLQDNNLIPKKIKYVHENILEKANLFSIKCVKNGNQGLLIDKPFILYDENKNKTREYSNILGEKYESKKL